MNPLAQELNGQLTSTVIGRLLSNLGSAMYFPKGIVAQSAEAKEKAHRLNATIGMAYRDGKALELPLLKEMLPGLSEAEAVSYAPTSGVPALRQRWRQMQIQRNPNMANIEYSLPTVVAGLTSGIFQTAELFVNTGDRIIIPDMFWGNYKMVFTERRGAEIDSFPFFSEQGGFNVNGFADQLVKSADLSRNSEGRGKIIIVLNFPNNPTGYSPSISEAEAICAAIESIAQKNCDVLTVHDDAYFGLFYDQSAYRQSLFVKCATLHENVLALKIDGATKEEYVWGFRVGFMSFASKGMSEQSFAPLLQKLNGSIRGTVSNCPGISQQLLLKMFDHPEYSAQKQQAERDLTARYNIVVALLENAYASPRGETLKKILTPLPFNSGYFMAFRVNGISAEALRLELLDRGIGSIAIGSEFLRIAYSAVDANNLEELYEEVFSSAVQLYQE